jgi:hypothetical protein
MVKEKGWTEKTQGNFNRVFKFEAKGDELQGIYAGKRPVKLEKDTVEMHSVTLDTLEVVDFWGTGKLNYLLEGVDAGTEIRIEYLGKISAKIKINGRSVTKEIHDYKLFTR